MDGPLVSIIIDNYNYECFLRQAIDSALNQTYPNIEVIVVDDGSTDNSREIIASYGARIIPVLNENGGQASAFNAGFAVSQGDIICFLDSDDVFLSDKVQVIINYFQKHTDIGWLFHGLEYINRHSEFFGQGLISQESKFVDLRDSIIRFGKIPFIAPATSGLCFRKKILEQILPMPESIKITSDNYIKFASLIISSGLYINKALAYQRIHGENAFTGSNDLQKRGYIHGQIAYYLALNFKESQKFAFKLMATSISDLLRAGSLNKCPKEVKEYFSSISIGLKLRLYLRCIMKAIQLTLKEFIMRT